MNQIIKAVPKTMAFPKAAKDIATFDDFAQRSQKLVDSSRKLEKVFRTLVSENCWTQSIREAENIVREAEGSFIASNIPWLAKAKDELEPENYYIERENEDPEMSPVIVLAMVTKMLAAFPPHNIPNVEAYMQILVEEILAREPNWFALNATLLKVRRTSKFVPTLSELLTVLDAEAPLWVDRLMVDEYWTDLLNEVKAEIPKAKQLVEDRKPRPVPDPAWFGDEQ